MERKIEKVTAEGVENAGVRFDEPESDDLAKRISVAVERGGGATNVARSIGCSTSVLRKWRSGQSEPVASALLSLAAIGNVDPAWLLSGDGTPDAGTEPAEAAGPRLDLDLLEHIVRLLRTLLEERDLVMPPAAEARAVRLLYQIYADREDAPRAETVAEVINLAAYRA
jgi:transcriptional regulator with XRE-family HTH domain